MKPGPIRKVPDHVERKLKTPTRWEMATAHKLLQRRVPASDVASELAAASTRLRQHRYGLGLGHKADASLKSVHAVPDMSKRARRDLAQRIRGIEVQSRYPGEAEEGVKPENMQIFAVNYAGWEGLRQYYSDLKIYDFQESIFRFGLGGSLWVSNQIKMEYAKRFLIVHGLLVSLFATSDLLTDKIMQMETFPFLSVLFTGMIMSRRVHLKGPWVYEELLFSIKSYMQAYASLRRLMGRRAFEQSEIDGYVMEFLKAQMQGEEDSSMPAWVYDSYNYRIPKLVLDSAGLDQNTMECELVHPLSHHRNRQRFMIDRLWQFEGDEPHLTVVVRILDAGFKFSKGTEEEKDSIFAGALQLGFGQMSQARGLAL